MYEQKTYLTPAEKHMLVKVGNHRVRGQQYIIIFMLTEIQRGIEIQEGNGIKKVN